MTGLPPTKLNELEKLVHKLATYDYAAEAHNDHEEAEEMRRTPPIVNKFGLKPGQNRPNSFHKN